jgi:methylmalonyl-CoA/ethylmalonyl-CoA epimerase
MTAELGLSKIGQIAVNIHDADRAVNFYQQALGMKMMFRAGQLAFFDAGSTRLMLSPPEKPEFDHPSSILYFNVPDILLAHTTLKGRGVKFEDEPHLIARMPTHELWMCFFRDSEQNLLALMSEVPKA